MTLSTYYTSLSAFYGGIFSAYKETKILGTTATYAAVINLAVNLLLFKFIGIYASAISTLVASLFLYLYRKYRMKSYFNAYEKNDIGIQVTFVFFFIAFYVNNQILNILTVIISLLTSIIINFKTICRFLKKLRIYAR